MKVRNFLFVVTFLLAAASLGFALHPKAKGKALPAVKTKTNSTLSQTNSTLSQTNSTLLPSNPSAQTSQVESVFADAAGDVSKECGAAILSIVTSPEFSKCLPVTAFLPLLPLVTDPSILTKFLADPANTYKNTIQKPLNEFASGICAAPKCSDEGVGKTIKTLQDGCKADLASNKLIQLAFTGAVFYSPLRDTVCFKDSKQFCLDQTILKVVSLPKSPFPISGIPLVDSVAVAEPQDICTKCNKNIVNTGFNFIKGNDLALKILAGFGIDEKKINELKIAVAVKCGAKFEDGQIEK